MGRDGDGVEGSGLDLYFFDIACFNRVAIFKMIRKIVVAGSCKYGQSNQSGCDNGIKSI